MKFDCMAYGMVNGPGLDEAPDTFWRRIELDHVSGRTLALVYDADPGEAEMKALMRKLQIGPNARYFHEIRVIGDTGVIKAPLYPGDA